MLAQLWRDADDAAQAAFRAMNDMHAKTGIWDSRLRARYQAAERIRDAVDAAIALELAADAQDDKGNHFLFPMAG